MTTLEANRKGMRRLEMPQPLFAALLALAYEHGNDDTYFALTAVWDAGELVDSPPVGWGRRP